MDYHIHCGIYMYYWSLTFAVYSIVSVSLGRNTVVLIFADAATVLSIRGPVRIVRHKKKGSLAA